MDFGEQRKRLVASMQHAGTIKSRAIADAFMGVKRELFFPGSLEQAYVDSAFPIGYGQTISQPSTIAVMLEVLEAEKGMKVLEVGSGCGYVIALLSELVGEEGRVLGIELVPELASVSVSNIKKAGIANASVRFGDGTRAMPENALFDRILVSAASGEVPQTLVGQLAPQGKLVAPVGSRYTQMMKLVEKDGQGNTRESFPYDGYFVFVPLKER